MSPISRIKKIDSESIVEILNMHLYIPKHELCVINEFVFAVDNIIAYSYIAINLMDILNVKKED